VRAIADNIDAHLSGQRVPPLSIEGTMTAQWILLDFGDVVVHVFRADIRDHYGLERLWNDARRIRLPAEPATAPASPLRSAKRRSPRAREQG